MKTCKQAGVAKAILSLCCLQLMYCDAWLTPTASSFSRLSPTRQDFASTTKTAFASTSSRKTRLYENGPFGFLSPYESKIPDELRDEIYTAEANTPAAQQRGQRVALYAAIAVLGVVAAFFNGFLTELRANGVEGEPIDLSEAGFGWVASNFLFSFFLLNKIGGGICLLGGAGAGLLAEAELDTKRINAEKIYEELERRREAKMKGNTKKTKASAKRKRRSGKEKKRLSALSEVVADERKATEDTSNVEEEEEEEEDTEIETPVAADAETTEPEKKGGIFGSVKDLYEKADTMAASQALLLNKKLEEAGVVDKITDESGLKVIGREEASKLEQTKEDETKEN